MRSDVAERALREANPIEVGALPPEEAWTPDALLAAIDARADRSRPSLAWGRTPGARRGPLVALVAGVVVFIVGFGLGALAQRPSAPTDFVDADGRPLLFTAPRSAVADVLVALNADDHERFTALLSSATVSHHMGVDTSGELWDATEAWRTIGDATYSIRSCTGGTRWTTCRLRVDLDPLRSHGLFADDKLDLSLDTEGRISLIAHRPWGREWAAGPSVFNRFLDAFADWAVVYHAESWPDANPWLPRELIDWDLAFDLWAEYLATSPDPVWLFPEELD